MAHGRRGEGRVARGAGRRGRRVAPVLAVTAAVAAVAVAAVAVLDQRGGPADARAAAVATPAPVPSRSPLLRPAPNRPLPSAAGLAAALRPVLRDRALGPHLVLSLVDATTGAAVLEIGAATPVLPASTAKIVTAVATLTAVPATRRLTTRVLAGAAPGDVVLVGGGDPTLAGPLAPVGYPRAARLTDLGGRARAALSGAAVRRVLVDDTLYAGPRLGPGWRPGYVGGGDVAPVSALSVDGGRVRPGARPRVPDPALAAGHALARLLGARQVVRGRAPAGARELARVDSAPVAQLVELMLTTSDNDLAEALARQVALARGRPASFAGAAAAVGATLAGAGLASGIALVDGSGLSRLDRLQPAALSRLLAQVASGRRPLLSPVLSGLPVAGFDGTLALRFRRAPALSAAGSIRGKTGTLEGVSALAGLLRTRDGRLLAFDLTADGVPAGRTLDAQAALDRVAAVVAGCGCR